MSSTQPAPAQAAPVQAAPAPAPAPTRQRRRPGLIGLGVALIAVCGLGGGWLATRGQDTHPVTVAAVTMPAGHTITIADVKTVQIPGEVAFAAESDPAALVGRIAGTTIPAESVISPAMVGVPPTAGEGKVIVAIPLKATQMPSIGLQSGDAVTVVAGTGQAAAPAAAPAAWAATVVNVAAPDVDGVRVVDVAMAPAEAPPAAAATTTGNVVLALTSRGK